MVTTPSRLLTLAARQCGAFTRKHANDIGISDRQISHRLATGDWERLYPGVYRLSAWPRSPDQQTMAAFLACGEFAFVSHRSAGATWGACPYPDEPEITVPWRRHPEIDGIHVYRASHTRPSDFVRKGSLRVASPAATLIDLAAVVAEDALEDALDDMVRRGLTTLDRVRGALGRSENRRLAGTGTLRKLVQLRADSVTGSHLETPLFRIMRRFALPLPVMQHPVWTPAGWRYIDFAHVDERVALEPMGCESHTSRQAFEDDRIRGRDLRALGWDVVELTWTAIHHRPHDVAVTIARSLDLVPKGWTTITGSGKPGWKP